MAGRQSVENGGKEKVLVPSSFLIERLLELNACVSEIPKSFLVLNSNSKYVREKKFDFPISRRSLFTSFVHIIIFFTIPQTNNNQLSTQLLYLMKAKDKRWCQLPMPTLNGN